jgi:uncharacterized protein YqgC (DUF456 family)
MIHPLAIVAVLLVVAGAAGTVLPGLPGAPLVFVGLVLAAGLDGFAKVGVFPLVLIGLLAVVALGVDLAASWLGVKKVGASRWAVVGAAVGTLAGLFFALPGLLFGPPLGALAGELLAGGGWKQAAKSGAGAFLGFLLGAVAKLGIVFLMVTIFLVAWFF